MPANSEKDHQWFIVCTDCGHKWWSDNAYSDCPNCKPAINTSEGDFSVHGSRSCRSTNRFWCVVCWREACWCKGQADDVELTLAAAHSNEVPTGDPGICNDCWASMHRDGGPAADGDVLSMDVSSDHR